MIHIVFFVFLTPFATVNVQILVPIANGTEEIEATFIIYILRRAGANVIVASIESILEIVASGEVKIIADVLLEEVLELSFDLIVLPVSLLPF